MKHIKTQLAWALCGAAQLAGAQVVTPAPLATAAPTLPAIGGGGPVPVVVVQGDDEVKRARNSAAAKTVVSSEVLNRYGDVSIIDALARIPGVSANQGALQVRGLGSGYTQVLVDGTAPRGISLAALSLSSVDRVEILRVATAEYGTQAIAGTINIILKKIPKPPSGRIKATAEHAYRPAVSLDAQGSQGRGNLGVSLGLLAQVRRSPYSKPQDTVYRVSGPDGVEIERSLALRRGASTLKTLNATPRFQLKVDDALSLSSTSFVNLSSSAGSTSEDFINIHGAPDLLRDLNASSQRSSHSISSSLTLVHKNNVGRLEAKIGLSRARSHGNADSFLPQIDPLAPYRQSSTRSKSHGGDLSAKYARRTAKNHQVVAGASYSNGVSRLDTTTLERFAGVTIDDAARSRIEKAALFAQDEWDLTAGSSIYLGLRWEHLAVESGTNTSPSQRYRSSVLSPIAQGLWKLDDKVSQIRLAISRTYKAPDSSMLLSPVERNINNSPVLPRFRGNIALKPELAWSLETAYEYAGGHGLEFNVRSYYRRINDLHRLQTSQLAGSWEVMYVNRGVGRSIGIEADARVAVNKYLSSAPDVTLAMSLARVWSRVDVIPGPDNTLEPRKLEASLNLDYAAKSLPLTAGASYRFSSAGWQRLSANERTHEQSARYLDFYASWRMNKADQLRLSIGNLLRADSRSERQFVLPDSRYDSIVRAQGYMNTKLVYEHKF